MAEERLQKLLAAAGVASRRASEELILAGRVKVNGHTVTELGTKVDPQLVQISVDGKLVRPHDVQVLTEGGERSEQAVVTRIVRLGFEVRVELLPPEGDLLTAQLSRAEFEQLEIVEGQIVHIRVDPTGAQREPANA